MRKGWLERAFNSLNPATPRVAEEQAANQLAWVRLDTQTKAKHAVKAAQLLYKNRLLPTVEWLSHYELLLLQRLSEMNLSDAYEYVDNNHASFTAVVKKLSTHEEEDAIVKLAVQELRALINTIMNNKRNGYENVHKL